MELIGRNAYAAFSKTVFLQKVQRQQGDDQAGFRVALEELRLLNSVSNSPSLSRP
jgi:ATP-dependent DNA helicase PIF1